jgi:mono/diheme cytochrome c family protein
MMEKLPISNLYTSKMRRKGDPGVQFSNSGLMAILFRIAILFLLLLPLNTTYAQDWVAPAEADKLSNPISSDATSIAMGKAFFTSICFVCHGDGGKGDGINAPSLERQPADLTSADVQIQSDGALFWKISEGNPPMLTFKDVLSEEQRWQLVNFIRTLAADKAPTTKTSTTASTENIVAPVINLYAGQTDGKELFRNICGACHTIGKGKLIGPDLKGATSRHDRLWLHRWIKSSTAMIESGDPDAVALFAENNNVLMPDQPYLDSSQVEALLVYIDDKSKAVSQTSASNTPISNVNTTQLQPASKELENILAKTLTISIFLLLLYVVLLIGKTYTMMLRNLIKR